MSRHSLKFIKGPPLASMVFFLWVLEIIISGACSAAPLLSYCPTQADYKLNSTFEYNLKLLLLQLSSNTSIAGGFYNTSVGNGTNQVYGLALCRGDVSPNVCQNCVENASQEILSSCPLKEDAIIWYDYCQLRYSYQKFFSIMVYAGKYPPWNNERANVSNPYKFSQILNSLLNDLIAQVASLTSFPMFAERDAKAAGVGKVVGMAQCTWDISRDDCENCLRYAMRDLEGSCSTLQGGMILDSSCDLTFQVSTSNGGGRSLSIIITSVAVPVIVLLAGSYAYYLWRRKARQRDEKMEQMSMPQQNQIDSSDLPLMDFETIKDATCNFSDSNKLGQGGFGTVYKGTLPDGKEIAVKRLSIRSWQGLEEFKNEVILIAKLQHRNLVRLIACGLQGGEKLLIYEFMPNISLDSFIFDPTRHSQLEWRTRYNIIDGIARGLVYLHEDSRLKIIHRDLKPSNVLLDKEMTAKISDFGMARIFCEEQNTANTKRVVGTYGYMSPEYAMEGIFSVKSDVFSFGVIVLEIISGKRNSSYLKDHGQTLLAYVWRLWDEGKALDFVDPLLISSCPNPEVLKCIQIGLLCVQRDATDRPTMSDVIVMLESDSLDLPQPKEPAFALGRGVLQTDQSSTIVCSVDAVKISTFTVR